MALPRRAHSRGTVVGPGSVDAAVCYECPVFRSPLAAACAAVAVFVLPTAALADSAGDNQYQDPFGNAPKQAQPKKKSSQPVSGNSQTSSPSSPAAVQPTAQASPAASAQPAASSGQLPHTGVDARLLAAVGAALLAAGLALRRLA